MDWNKYKNHLASSKTTTSKPASVDWGEYKKFLDETYTNYRVSKINEGKPKYESNAFSPKNRQQVAYSGRYDSKKGKIGYSNYLKTKEPKSKDIDFGNLFALAGYSTGSNEALPNISETTYGLRQDTSYKEPGEDWLDEEKNIFGYLWENDRAAAEKYATEVNNAVNRYKKDLKAEKVAEYSTENFGQGILASVSSIASNAGSGSDYLADLVEYNARGVVTEKEDFLTPYEYTQAVRGSIASDLNEYGTILGKGLGDAYQIGMSAADSFVYGRLGISDPAFFGIGATAAMNEARERRVSENQAFAYGLTSGIMEAVFEHIGIDNMLKMKSPHTLSQAFKGILKQSGVEALEEMGTELTNTAWDAIINMDKSEFVASYANYISEGKGRGEALARAFADLGGEVLWAGISGALSGTMTGTAQTGFAKTGEIFGDAVNKADARKAVKDLGKDKDAVLDYAMETEEGSEVRKAAEDIRARTERGEKVSNKEYADVLLKTDDNFAKAEIKRQLEAEAMSTGEELSDEQLDSMSTAVLKTIKGKMVSKQENAQIEQSQSAKNVYARNMGVDYTYGEQLSKEKKAELKETRTQQVLSEVVKDHSEGYKQTLTKAYEDYAQGNEALKMDAEDFANEFSSFYDIGKAGVESVDRALEAYGKGNPQLTNALARAYELGRGEAIVANKASVENKQAEIDAKLEAAKGRKVTSVGQVRLATEAELKNPKVAAVGGKVVTKGKKLSKQHRAIMQFVREFAKLSGINVVLYEGGKSRGWYDSVNNEIYLNIEEGMNLKTLSHELTHFIQEHSPKQYEEFKQFLLDYYKSNGKYQQLLQQAHKVQRDLAAEELEDEIVANACQMFISDTDAMQKLIDTQSKGLIDTITRWFNNMCDYLRQAFEGVHASHAAAQALEEDIEMLEKARDKWYELLNESITVNKKINGAQSTTSQVKKADSKAKFELKDDEYMTAVNNGDMKTAQKLVDEAAKAAGYNIHAFHGTSRGDRVGNVFLPERATSGPMAFFTDDKATAEGYATGKRDTSIAYDPDFDSYETQFRVKVSGMDIPFHRAWGYLPFDARNRVAKKAGQLREDWDGDNELILDPETNEANGGFQWQLKEARGNVIKALIDQWLNSGNLFNEEAKFLDVIEMSGLKEEFAKVGINTIYFKDPNARYEKVYDVYLKMDRPFDTAKVNKRFVTNLLKWYDKQDERKYQRENMESDLWDKNGIDAYEFAERLERDIENNTTHAWTSIPDSVTDYLKHLKYDGIKDLGGKFHETTHTVWIPFYSEQIKTTEPVTYDNKGKVIPLSERFNDYDRDIRFEMKDSEGNDLSPEQAEFFKNSKMRDENGALKVMHHGTDSAGFTVFDPGFSDDGISLFFSDSTDVAGSYSYFEKDQRYNPYGERRNITTAKEFEALKQKEISDVGNNWYITGIDVRKIDENTGEYFRGRRKYCAKHALAKVKWVRFAARDLCFLLDGEESSKDLDSLIVAVRKDLVKLNKFDERKDIEDVPEIAELTNKISVACSLMEDLSTSSSEEVKTKIENYNKVIQQRNEEIWHQYDAMRDSQRMASICYANIGKWMWYAEEGHGIITLDGNETVRTMGDSRLTERATGTEKEVVAKALEFGNAIGMFESLGNRYDVYLNIENPYVYEGEQIHEGDALDFTINYDGIEFEISAMMDEFGHPGFSKTFEDYFDAHDYIALTVKNKDIADRILKEFREQYRRYNEGLLDEEELIISYEHIPIKSGSNDYWNNLKGPDGRKTNTRGITKYAKENGYDGVIFKNIYDNGGQSHYEEADVPSTIAVAFSSEQVKDIDNKKPTKDKDIRFEVKDSDGNVLSTEQEEYFRDSKARDENGNLLDYYVKQKEQFELKDEDENRLEILENQEERLVNDLKTIEKYYGDAIRQVYEQNIKPNEGISKRAEELNRKAARRFMNEVGAMFQVPKDTREEYLLPIINEMIDKGPAISDRESLIERLYQTAYEHTEDYIVDTDPEGNYKNLRNYIRKTSIFVNAGTKADVGDYNNFRKHNMGSLRLTSDQTALGLDEFYEEISNLAPEIFSGTTDGAEQLYELSSFMKDRGRTESIGDYMPQAEYTAWADETLEPELNKLFDSTVGSFLSEASRKEKERQRAAKVDRAMENVSGAIRNYEAAQDYARAEGVLAGQIEQGKKDAAEMRRMQESYERKAKNYEDMLEAKRAKIKEIRQRRDEILAERKAAFEAYREQRNETIRSGGLKKSIEKNAKTLYEWLMKNSDKEHVPEVLKTTVGDFLESIDFTSKRGLAGGEATKKDQAFAKRLNNLASMLEKQRNYMNKANDSDAENPLDCFLDLPEGFAEEIRKLADDVAKTAIGGNFVVNEMNSAQLAQLNQALRVLKTSISKMNKLITNAHFASVTEAARSSMLEMAEYKAHKPMNDISEQADKMLKWEMFTPVYAFKRYGNAGESIFKGIQKGWSDFAFAIDKVLKFTEGTYTDKEVEAWEKETHSIKLSDGNTVTLTSAQLMSLYCLNKREQARGHIYGGGIRIADIKKGKVKIQQTEPYLVSFEDVETLISELTDRQIAVADKLQKFMTEQGSEWGNKVSMERFGYRAFTEDNYFPIESDANNLIAIDPEAKANDMFRLLNMSATKSLTKGANNAIVISDIFDIFSNHMSDMAKYGTLALPILDTMKWYNYKVRYDVGDGQFRTETVQKSVERAYGKAGKSYFTNFMKDLNGVKEGGRGIGLVNKMVSNYKIASVGANLRVAVLQPTSIVRASMEIEPKYILQALTKAPAAKKAESKSGIALWKSLGFYNTDIARGIRDQIKGGGKTIDKVRDKTMILAEKMDRITFGTLWNAAEAKAKDLGYSGEELDVKTTEIFDNIIYKTQVVDSTLTRSSLMRSTNEAVKSITAFMAEPTLSYNMVAETVYDMAKERDFSTGWQKNSERFGKAVAIYAASSIAAAVIESIPDAFRDDDDDEWFGQKWWQAFWGERFWDGNLWSEINVLEKIPIIKDFISVRKGYDIQRLDAAWMSSLNKAIEINRELFNVYVKGEKPTKTTYWGNMTAYGAAYANLRALSQIAGLPVSNTVRDVVAIWNTIVGRMAPSLKLKTYDDSKKN